ncbi:septation protein SepH [uncultured Bifidobacterium sp.]|uniref:septation protein SepH n=1 Tax=uncultured Bifidobacterium sp. TaxID=165187 RepID=UPI00261D0AE1|nr:septation protein SepH [uncultured Bifidobacterium sp.]
MPDNSPVAARFDHVGPEGELIFTTGEATFAVTVDDTLNKAILEARQIIADSRNKPSPAAPRVPISQIQSLIRAGANPTKVAEHYNLSETLVRRFSTAVETEKQYAIEQFLSVSAPKDVPAHSLGEMIESSLVAMGTGMEGASWSATRRGLEPWRISARFTTSSGAIKPEWSWDMHDNSVSCMNESARRLLGLYPPQDDSEASTDPRADSQATPFPAPTNRKPRNRREAIPGRAIQSARIERAVSSWALPEPGTDGEGAADKSRTRKGTGAAADGQPSAAEEPLRIQASRHPRTDHTTRRASSLDPVAVVAEASSPSSRGSLADNLASVSDADDERPARERSASSTNVGKTALTSGHASDEDGQGQNSPAADRSSSVDSPETPSTQQSKGARKHSGRSAVPSWDEILFGD